MKKIISITSALLFMAGVSVAQVAPYQNKELSIEERVEDLMSRMTLDEKISYIHGMRTSGGHSATQWDGTPACERLGIQPLKIYHGPYGVGSYRYTNKNGVYYPSSINMATTWNPELVEEITTSLSRELKAAGGQSSAGPAMNIIRDLRGGRSMEYFTEDPYLNGEIAAAYVKGVQSQRNFAIMKHYLANNQDYLRFGMDTYVSERAIREIYLPGYKAAVEKGGVMGVMTGYNLVNGIHNSAHKHQINEILKGEFGFKGVVMTDWVGSANNGRFMLEAGLDLEMPRALKYKPAAIKELLNKGEIDISLIDEKVRRVLYLTFWCGVMDEKPSINKAEIATPECVAVARRAAEEAIVLLKNEGDILPLDRTKVKKIAVIGPNGEFGAHFRNGQHNYQMLQGGGSATVAPPKGKLITPFVGVKNAAKGIEVNFEAGCYGDHGYTIIQPEFLLSKMGEKGLDATYFSDDNFGGTKANKIDPKVDFRWYNVPDIIERDDSKPNKKFSVKWSGKIVAPETRKYGFELNSVGNATLYINKKKLIDITSSMHAEKYGVGEIELKKGEYEIRIEYQVTANDKELVLKWNYGEEEYLKRAVELAKSSDVVIMAVGTSGSIETEAQDRSILLGRSDYLALSAAQERLIKEIAKVNSKVIVSTFTAGVVCEEWRNLVPAIIYAGFPGQEGANALGDIIFGDVNPSAKLTVSIPKSTKQFPDSWHSEVKKMTYDEGIFVGYRYFDKYKKEPGFPFGHGLSYTTFKYGEAKAVKVGDQVKVSLAVTNSGKVRGKEVVQLYVSDVKCSVERPKKELKAFDKIDLKPGESKVVEFTLGQDAFAFWSDKSNKWMVEPGEFKILIGSSSEDIRSQVAVSL